MEHGAIANERSMHVGLMDGACAGRGGGKMLSSGIASAGGFADIAVSTVNIYVCPSPLHNRSVFSFLFTAHKEQASKGSE